MREATARLADPLQLFRTMALVEAQERLGRRRLSEGDAPDAAPALQHHDAITSSVRLCSSQRCLHPIDIARPCVAHVAVVGDDASRDPVVGISRPQVPQARDERRSASESETPTSTASAARNPPPARRRSLHVGAERRSSTRSSAPAQPVLGFQDVAGWTIVHGTGAAATIDWHAAGRNRGTTSSAVAAASRVPPPPNVPVVTLQVFVLRFKLVSASTADRNSPPAAPWTCSPSATCWSAGLPLFPPPGLPACDGNPRSNAFSQEAHPSTSSLAHACRTPPPRNATVFWQQCCDDQGTDSKSVDAPRTAGLK